MISTLHLTGLNHKTAPLLLREKLLSAMGSVPAALKSLQKKVEECVILNTCNRIEFYYRAEETLDVVGFLTGEPNHRFDEHLYQYRGHSLISHLYETAASLDSLIVGETQILGQVKDAYELSRQQGLANSLFHNLFQGAIQGAKDIHSQTTIGQGHVSLSSVSVDLCRQIWEDTKDIQLLLLGSGTMAEQILKGFKNLDMRNPWIASRTFEHAQDLAQQTHGVAIPWERWPEHLLTTDILVTATSATQPLISSEIIKNMKKKRSSRPLLIIDIAVPRNVSTDIDSFDEVYRYDIENLGDIINQNTSKREHVLSECRDILSGHIDRLIAKLNKPDLSELYRLLDAHSAEIQHSEIARISRLIPEEYHDNLRDCLRRFSNKLLHPLKQNAPDILESREEFEALLFGKKK